MKIKSFFVRIMPDRQQFQNHPGGGRLSRILQDPDIFHLTRRSAAGGVATGLFIAFLPVPGHTLFAAFLAIILRVNLPLSVLFTWVTNPFTFAPIFYLAYRTGAALLGSPVLNVNFEMSWSWFGGRFLEIWPSLLCGSLIFAIISSATSYGLIRMLWRIGVVNKWKLRNKNRLKRP